MSDKHPLIAITQRVYRNERGEAHDALDQLWYGFLARCGIVPVIVPNAANLLCDMLKNISISGVLLTGGNGLVKYGGDAPERDETEKLLLEYAKDRNFPVLGVCRGMQVIQDYYGVALERVSGHVVNEQEITINGRPETVNSYHDFGARSTVSDLEVWASAADGVIKAIRHRHRPIVGVMWHPERIFPHCDRDVQIVKDCFAGVQCME